MRQATVHAALRGSRMSAGVDRRRDGSRRATLTSVPPNPTCEFPRCGAPCFSFGEPMYVRTIHVCGVHATGPAAAWYKRRRNADA